MYLNDLKKYFFAATAESEKNFLDDVFVTSADFKNIIEPIPGAMCVLVGNKGSGKSAILERLVNRGLSRKIPVIRITPSDLTQLDFDENTSPAKIINSVKESVINYMAIECGKNLSGLLSDSQKKLYDAAINAGANSKKGIDKLADFIKPIGKAITNIDFDMICESSSTQTQLTQSVKDQCSNNQKTFYVLMDDIDQISSVERKDRNDIIWGVILAMFNISQELDNVFPIITVRKEIWRQITTDNGNRDKFDQIRNMVHILEPTREDMGRIIKKRLAYCLNQNCDKSYSNPYEPFFEGTDCKLPTTNDERRRWEDYLVSSSRGTPRDIIQLVNHLICNAIKNDRIKITDDDVDDTALTYSRERVEDLITQNQDFCTGLDNVIRSFSAEKKFEFSADEIKKHLNSSLGVGRVSVNKKIIHPNDGSIFLLWDALSNIGFLNAQSADYRQAKQYSFKQYEKGLICESRWNDMQKYSWHISPCYRSYLIDIQNNEKIRSLFPSQKKALNDSHSKKKKHRR